MCREDRLTVVISEPGNYRQTRSNMSRFATFIRVCSLASLICILLAKISLKIILIRVLI